VICCCIHQLLSILLEVFGQKNNFSRYSIVEEKEKEKTKENSPMLSQLKGKFFRLNNY